jgi:hypothetical protein
MWPTRCPYLWDVHLICSDLVCPTSNPTFCALQVLLPLGCVLHVSSLMCSPCSPDLMWSPCGSFWLCSPCPTSSLNSVCAPAGCDLLVSSLLGASSMFNLFVPLCVCPFWLCPPGVLTSWCVLHVQPFCCTLCVSLLVVPSGCPHLLDVSSMRQLPDLSSMCPECWDVSSLFNLLVAHCVCPSWLCHPTGMCSTYMCPSWLCPLCGPFSLYVPPPSCSLHGSPP